MPVAWSNSATTNWAESRQETAMLCTKQKVLRRFWYATVPVDRLADGPKPFTLLGENIVLFLDSEGKPAALADRCCHRTAKLSKGWSDDGLIICGYHGWTYDRTGKLVRIPQFARISRCRKRAFGPSAATPVTAMPGWRWRSRCCRSRTCHRSATQPTAASTSST